MLQNPLIPDFESQVKSAFQTLTDQITALQLHFYDPDNPFASPNTPKSPISHLKPILTSTELQVLSFGYNLNKLVSKLQKATKNASQSISLHNQLKNHQKIVKSQNSELSALKQRNLTLLGEQITAYRTGQLEQQEVKTGAVKVERTPIFLSQNANLSVLQEMRQDVQRQALELKLENGVRGEEIEENLTEIAFLEGEFEMLGVENGILREKFERIGVEKEVQVQVKGVVKKSKSNVWKGVGSGVGKGVGKVERRGTEKVKSVVQQRQKNVVQMGMGMGFM